MKSRWKMKLKKRDNIVRIGGSDKTEIYEHEILVRMKPDVYNETECIVIQCISSRLEFAEVIIKRFSWAGLKEEERKKKPIKVVTKKGDSYILPDAWEIKLIKIPVLSKQ